MVAGCEEVDFLPPDFSPIPRGENCGSGLVVVDKPRGLTSNQVLSRVRRLAGQKKVGYAGTLDPLATGVLIFALGKATKVLQYLSARDKAYLARVRFGTSTDTDDAEGKIVTFAGAPKLDRSQLEQALRAYRGRIQQVPSVFSAVKIAGQRAYNLARQGKTVTLHPREVTIKRLELISDLATSEITINAETRKLLPPDSLTQGRPELEPDSEPALDDAETKHLERQILNLAVCDVDMVVECTAGTYIRALARDLGRDLGVGAHLRFLRRTRTGDATLTEARSLQDLATEVATRGKLTLIPVDEALMRIFPVMKISEREAKSLSYGQSITCPRTVVSLYNGSQLRLAAVDAQGRVVALVDALAQDSAGSVVQKQTRAGLGVKIRPVWVLRPGL